MSRFELRDFQRTAMESILEVFQHAGQQLNQVSRPADRRKIIAYNGCALLQAPTGSGKTLMAGRLAETLSQQQELIWLWFAPFAGLIDQSKASLKAQCSGLRVLNIQADRQLERLRSGDVFVTTWASVATRNKESRKLRTDTELDLSLDRLIEAIRDAKFRVGVIIDEAHHGFKATTESARFYQEVLDPDYTLLVTATPDDRDADAFRKRMDIAHLHRVTVSREEAVAAGLIKRGVRTVAYLADESQKRVTAFADAALQEGWAIHTNLKESLKNAGIPLTPLMLVQVNDSGKQKTSVEDTKNKLLSLGVPDSQIAVYTAQEPDMKLIEVAQDETIEVLIFKVAAAQGFDAPRAFTLVSLRQGVRDTDFGIQTVGRILRIHRRVQGKLVEPNLHWGYVILADASQQEGLSQAASRINAIKTGLAQHCPYTLVVNRGGESEIQVSRTGQSSLLPQEDDTAVSPSGRFASTIDDSGMYTPPPASLPGSQLPLFDGGETDRIPAQIAYPTTAFQKVVTSVGYRYKRRSDVPSTFCTERIPAALNDILKCVGHNVRIDAQVLNDGLRENVRATKIERELFDPAEVRKSKTMIPLDNKEIAIQAQKQLFEAGPLDPRESRKLLLDRLRHEYQNIGNPIADQPEALKQALNKILVLYPDIIRLATSKCYSAHSETFDTQALADELAFDEERPHSDGNSYGIMPPGLNNDEQDFAQRLDADDTDTVIWWHRNEVNKPDSVALVLPSGRRYFPDFVVKVNGRNSGTGLLLIEVKGRHLLNTDETKEKLVRSHKIYGNPLMVSRVENGDWMTVAYNQQRGKAEFDRRFDTDLLASHVVSVR